jgi:hypothetical protein
MLCISAALTALIAWLTRNNITYSDNVLVEETKMAGTFAAESVQAVSTSLSVQPWMWFALGCLVAMIIVTIVNWKKM